ncbi:MAG: acyl-CoA thioesterase [Saprospiraceae bacterium]
MNNSTLPGFNCTIEIPVAWGDMDAAQHVNNTMYLRYGETGRIQYLKDIGFDFDLNGIGLILAELNIKYKFPLTFPDQIIVGTRTKIETIDEFGFWAEQQIFSQKYQRVSALMHTRLVCYDFKNLVKVALSAEDVSRITKFEQGI